jgi:hypothetical protein
MSCKIQTALTEAWFAATKEFSTSIKAMTGIQIAAMSNAAYTLSRARAERARMLGWGNWIVAPGFVGRGAS